MNILVKKAGRILFGAALLLLFTTGCLRKPSRKQVVESSLKSAMSNYLNDPARTNRSVAKFTVLEVVYYEGKQDFQCEFKVHLKNISTDTVGTMGAVISKDFSQVKRKY